MITIPTINCESTECARDTLRVAATLAPSWIQIDVSDGIFASTHTFNDPFSLKKILDELNFHPNIEIHLMVDDPESFIGEWLTNGTKRIIVHAEAVRDMVIFETLKRVCSAWGAELGIALRPETDPEEVKKFLEGTDFIQVLAVHPGRSGQHIDEDMIKKIQTLRILYPHATIEIDGGINEETAKEVKMAGATAIVSASYIFKGEDPVMRYKKLMDI